MEGSLDPYANYTSHVDFARAKLQLIQHPRWGVNLKTDAPSEVIDKIEGTPIVWGTLFSPAAQRALETGRGIVKRYRTLGITDIQSARKKYYCEKMTAIGRQVGQMMAGGDPNVTYTPDFERKARPIPPQNPTPIEPPVVPPIRPRVPGQTSPGPVGPQPDLKQGPLPLTEEAFDALAFTRRSEARLMNGQKVTVTAVDFAKRQISHHKNGHPYWVELNQIAAIS